MVRQTDFDRWYTVVLQQYESFRERACTTVVCGGTGVYRQTHKSSCAMAANTINHGRGYLWYRMSTTVVITPDGRVCRSDFDDDVTVQSLRLARLTRYFRPKMKCTPQRLILK